MKDARKAKAKRSTEHEVPDETRNADATAAAGDAEPSLPPDAAAAEDAAGTSAATPAAADEPTAAEAPHGVEDQRAAERDEMREKWLRTLADLDNLRKRSRREIEDARRFAQVEVLRPLLDIADNFDRAVASLGPESEVTADAVREGVGLIHQSFRGLLRERGVEPIEALGREFDPNEHEAVAQMASEDYPTGVVVEVVQQGYRFGDLVLRPARVVIAT